jgi:hypothetical protein
MKLKLEEQQKSDTKIECKKVSFLCNLRATEDGQHQKIGTYKVDIQNQASEDQFGKLNFQFIDFDSAFAN